MGMNECVSTPVIPDAPEWSAIDRLNREKELVGIYISAHPLDEYRVILEHVCNVGMAQLAEREKLVNRELTFGGIVIAMRESRMKNGKPCGFAKVEDFTGSHELAFFGENWLKWRNMMVVGNFLFIKGMCQASHYIPDRIDLNISSIELLQDVRKTVIHSMTVCLPLSVLDKELVSDIDTLTMRPGDVTLKFEITDLTDDSRVSLASASRKIEVTADLIDYLEKTRNLQLKFNQ